MPKFHSKGANGRCVGCVKLLESAHPALGEWFWEMEAGHPGLHIARSWRGEKDQNEAFSQGLSGLQWPHSEHNRTENGKPCSHALDLFEIDDKGLGLWRPVEMARINALSISKGYILRWGGNFKTLGDSGHFELPKKT